MQNMVQRGPVVAFWAQLNIKNINLERVKHVKFLGMLIDDCLSWKHHIDCVSKTISRNIGVMNKLQHFVPTRILYYLYCTQVLPYLNNGILIFGDTCKSYLNKLINSKSGQWEQFQIATTEAMQTQSLPIIIWELRVIDMYALELGTFMYRNSISKLPSSFNSFLIISQNDLMFTITQQDMATT